MGWPCQVHTSTTVVTKRSAKLNTATHVWFMSDRGGCANAHRQGMCKCHYNVTDKSVYFGTVCENSIRSQHIPWKCSNKNVVVLMPIECRLSNLKRSASFWNSKGVYEATSRTAFQSPEFTWNGATYFDDMWLCTCNFTTYSYTAMSVNCYLYLYVHGALQSVLRLQFSEYTMKSVAVFVTSSHLPAPPWSTRVHPSGDLATLPSRPGRAESTRYHLQQRLPLQQCLRWSPRASPQPAPPADRRGNPPGRCVRPSLPWRRTRSYCPAARSRSSTGRTLWSTSSTLRRYLAARGSDITRVPRSSAACRAGGAGTTPSGAGVCTCTTGTTLPSWRSFAVRSRRRIRLQ